MIQYRNNKFRNGARVFSMAGGFVFALSVSAFADVTLVFGTYAADKPTEVVKKFKPFLNYLSKDLTNRLGEPVTVKMKIAKEYQESIDQLANGSVDFARFGPASYITAKNSNPNVSIVAMESKKGKKRFNGVIVVHEDSKITELSELADKSFAFGNELSTIGRYLSQSHLLDSGISGVKLQRYEFLGRHDLVGSAVGSKTFEAGALKESTYKKLVEKEVPIKVLYSFENVTKPWLAKSDLEPNVLEAMRNSMLSESGAEAVKAIAKNGFLPGNDQDYDIIRDAMIRSQEF